MLPWYRQALPQMVMAGFLPFSAIYIELCEWSRGRDRGGAGVGLELGAGQQVLGGINLGGWSRGAI